METRPKELMVQEVRFNGDTINVIEQDGEHYVAMKPICEALGLSWKAQHQLIQRDPVLSSVICIIQTTGADGKTYEMLCLPLSYLNGWLFKVDAARYEGERREKIIRYQKECYQVLFHYFFGKPSDVYLTMRRLETELARIKLMISSELPVEVFHYKDMIVRLFIVFEQPGLYAPDIIHILERNWSAGFSQAPSRLERFGLRRDHHFIVTSIGRVAAHLGLTPDYLLARARLGHSVRGMTFILPHGMSLLRHFDEELYDWYCHTVYPAIPRAYRAYADRRTSLALLEGGEA